ncbi:cytochrome c biogenesis protein CcsA [Paenibacillus sp. 1P07SE]|uniref:cytochrome c biogenesis protein CcsA n=1 Tax=Paenibacillus sp. 1P07SE TaxID=3132209 RepID=UPI0039A66C2A
MVFNNYLYDMMIYVYALSLLFYFSDLADASQRAKRMGTGLLIFVWVIQTAILVYQLTTHRDMSTVSMFEYLFLFSWLLITISLMMSRFFRVEYLVFFVNVIGFVILAINLFSRPAAVIGLQAWERAIELLYIHITLITCAYVVLTIGAIFAGMYLFLHGKLKGRKWSPAMRRLPSLATIERYVYRTALIGTPLLILSLAVAIASIIVEGQSALLLDWKVFSSVLGLGFYLYYLIRRNMLKHSGVSTARWNLISFGLLLINLFLNSASQFHNWT